MLARRTDVKQPTALTKALLGALSLVDSLTVKSEHSNLGLG